MVGLSDEDLKQSVTTIFSEVMVNILDMKRKIYIISTKTETKRN